MGGHVVPLEYAADPDAYVKLVCTEMLQACAPCAKWIDVFCERGAFDADQSRAILAAGADAGLGLRVHANQLEAGPGVQLAVEMGAASADHCTYLSEDDLDALAASSTVATVLPATDFSTRQPYADARRLLDAGATVAIATNTNPGSSYTSSMSFCIALAVRDMRLTIAEAIQAATVGGAAALRRTDIGRLSPGARADAVILSTPTYADLVYRPGMPLIAATIAAGVVTTTQ
jgi:imidazolonepropionase